MVIEDSDDADGPVWRDRLDKSILWVRGWETDAGAQPHAEPGSELARDDVGWPSMPISQLAWIGLSSAIEHLSLACDDLERSLSGQGALRPRAPFTLTRSALMGASQAVWLLAPAEASERVRRGWHVALAERQEFGRYVNDFLGDEHLEGDFSEASLRELDEAGHRIAQERKALEGKVGGASPRSMTRIIREAVEHLAADDLDRWQRRAFTSEWRLSSAAAHARMWPLHVRPTRRIPLRDGTGELRILEASLRECAQSFGSAALMTNEAVRLWERRRRRPNAGASFGL